MILPYESITSPFLLIAFNVFVQEADDRLVTAAVRINDSQQSQSEPAETSVVTPVAQWSKSAE
jgi:hypothetical protein